MHIPVAGFSIFQPGQSIKMGPAQFGRQRLPNWEGLIKTAHVTEIGGIKAPAKALRQALGEPLQLGLAIASPRGPFLLVLNNQSAYLPVSLHHGRIYGLSDLVTRLLDQFTNLVEQPVSFHSIVAHGKLRFL